MSIVDLLFGGGAGEAEDALQKGFSEAASYQRPYYEAGQRAGTNLEGFLSSMQDPSSYYERLMSGYKPSTSFNMKKNRILEMLSNQAAATGRFGTPSQTREETDYLNDLLGSDMQTYLNNILGIGDRYQSGESGLYQGGVTAAGNLGNMAMQRAQAEAQARMANANKWEKLLGGFTQLGADYLTGGWGAAIEPFTSRGSADLSWRAGRWGRG